MKNLREKVKELIFTLPLMEGKEKGDIDDLMDKVVTINGYGFLQGDTGNYAVFTVKEDDENFYFGGMVITDALEELEGDGYRSEILQDGLPIRLSKKMSKNKRNYTSCEFYPE